MSLSGPSYSSRQRVYILGWLGRTGKRQKYFRPPAFLFAVTRILGSVPFGDLMQDGVGIAASTSVAVVATGVIILVVDRFYGH